MKKWNEYNSTSSGSSSKVPFNKEENGHSSCVTDRSPCEPKLKRDFEEFPSIFESCELYRACVYENMK